MIKNSYGKINLEISKTRKEMGKTAARKAASLLRELLKIKEEVCCVFAAAPSQSEFLMFLSEEDNIDWSRVIALHMDEYIGMAKGDKSSFGTFLDDHFFSKV